MTRFFLLLLPLTGLVLAIAGSASADRPGDDGPGSGFEVICHKPDRKAEKTLRLPAVAARNHVRSHGDLYGECDRGRDRRRARIRTVLVGAEEVPAVSTTAKGRFVARLDREDRELEYRLRYADLESDIRFAHIHFGQRGASGGVVAWLCAAADVSDAPAGTPVCSGNSGEVTGMLDADDIVGPEDQGISPGEAAEVVRAFRQGLLYVNVHSERFPAGELRGQLD